jgi:hypothetical protein
MVFVEGGADSRLVRELGVPRKQVRIENGRNRVLRRLENVPNAIGLVDEDPENWQGERELRSYSGKESAEGLRLLSHGGKTGQRLIVVCPKLEDWLIHRARASKIKPEDYGLSSDPDRLHSMAGYEQKDGFVRFVRELMNRGDKGMCLLHQWLFQRSDSA